MHASTPACDKPFMICKLDLSMLNSLIGSHFTPGMWLWVPNGKK